MTTALAPAALTAEETPAEAFGEHLRDLADWLLGAVFVQAGDARHRVLEVETYFHGRRHRDPFAHRDRRQTGAGDWYFHRQGPSFRGGSFKGLDLTFGPPGRHGGVLLRSLEGPGGAVVCGPSLVVDRLLADTGHATVAGLAAAVGSALGRGGPLRLVPRERQPLDVLRTARVGLTLKRWHPDKPAYLARRDRTCVEPRRLTKGRAQMIVALHEDGHDVDAIRARLGSPRPAIRRLLAAYEAGLRGGHIDDHRGPLPPAELARLLGAIRRSRRRPG